MKTVLIPSSLAYYWACTPREKASLSGV